MLKRVLKKHLFDIGCSLSIVGVWPRFIEPNLLAVTSLTLPVKNSHLNGLSIVLLSDLHFSAETKDSFLKKVSCALNKLKPDLLLFSGDFIIRSNLEQEERLLSFLKQWQAPLGSFAVLGNHDYAAPLSINKEGAYDTGSSKNAHVLSDIQKGLSRLFYPKRPTGLRTENAEKVQEHKALLKLLSQSPVQVLHNQNQILHYKGEPFNLCGLGDYMSGHFRPEIAFSSYDAKQYGIVLCHNPDAVKILQHYPGELILSGHTHGAQINLPLIWNQLTCLENPLFKRGLVSWREKQVYISRGLGGRPFRFFSLPEMTHITLKSTS